MITLSSIIDQFEAELFKHLSGAGFTQSNKGFTGNENLPYLTQPCDTGQLH